MQIKSRDCYLGMLPQDPMISTVEKVALPQQEVGKQLSTARLHTEDSVEVARADADGNYSYPLETPQFDQVNTFGVVAGTVLTYERYMGHPTKWSFKGPLVIHPHAGEGKTAYYSRWNESINFCQWDSPSAGKVVKTSQSFDIGSHETGHALLDGIRPGVMGGSEGSAFHEAFGDCSALIHSLQYDTNLTAILAENGGDFSQPSRVTRLAEEFGTAYNKEDDDPNNNDRPHYRTALNDFKYQDPKTLPKDSYPPKQPEEVLTSEAHSFSRVWTGAFYRMLGTLYNQFLPGAANQVEALKSARDVLGTLWTHGLDHLPAANLKFRHAAMGMLREADKFEGGRYFDSLAAVMVDRQLLTQEQVDQAHSRPVPGPIPSENWQADPPQPGAGGRRVLTYRAPQRVSVDLGTRGQAEMELHSGLTQVYDAAGQLVSQTYTPLTAEDIADARDEALAHLDGPGQAEVTPWLAKARLVSQLDGPPLLVRIPVCECH